MSTPDVVLQKAEQLLVTIQSIVAENTQLKEEIKMFMQENQAVQQQAMFMQNLTNQMAHFMKEDREADGQWKMKQFIFQVQIRAEGEKIEIGRSQLLKASPIVQPKSGLVLP